jgi:hypothetical protein
METPRLMSVLTTEETKLGVIQKAMVKAGEQNNHLISTDVEGLTSELIKLQKHLQ